MAAYKHTLRALALNDEDFLESVLGMGRSPPVPRSMRSSGP